MKKNLSIRTNGIIIVIIVIGFLLSAIVNYFSYSKIIKSNIENISKLASTNIYSEINNELTKPIYVSLTMANDSFLKDWLTESERVDAPEYKLSEMRNYLLGLKSKYQYNSVFVVSEKTKRYYHYKGINKVVSTADYHDQWYYQFVDKLIPYELDVDTDEVDNNKLTVFINCRIEDDNGKLLGVAGVGVDISQIQNTIEFFQNTYDLETYLVDKNGTIQIHARTDYIEQFNIFEIDEMKESKDKILSNRESLQIIRYNKDLIDGYYITRYIDELDWYLVVKKDTSVLRESFIQQLVNDFIIIALVLGALLVIISKLFTKHQKNLIEIAKTDSLSLLPNRRAFDEAIEETFNENDNIFYAFILDIDKFKELNDKYGHLLGDKLIKTIAKIMQAEMGEEVFVARWGGDEFAGIVKGDKEEVVELLTNFIDVINQNEDLKEYDVKVSIGVSKAMGIDTYDTLMSRVDQGLYEAKASTDTIVFK